MVPEGMILEGGTFEERAGQADVLSDYTPATPPGGPLITQQYLKDILLPFCIVGCRLYRRHLSRLHEARLGRLNLENDLNEMFF